MQRAPTGLFDDIRGLATGIIGFVAIIIVVALLYTLMDPAADLIFSMSSSQSNSAAATDAINQRQRIWTSIPIFFMFLALLFVVSRAVFESRGPG